MDLQEIFHATDGGDNDDDDDDDDGALYSPLSCDLCQKVFTTPAEWVRHIEAHPENQQQQHGRRTGRQSRVNFLSYYTKFHCVYGIKIGYTVTINTTVYNGVYIVSGNCILGCSIYRKHKAVSIVKIRMD